MGTVLDYEQKFDSFGDRTLYERLDSQEKLFIRELARTYCFTFQEFRQVVEASRDLSMWREGNLEAWWENQIKLCGWDARKKKLLGALRDYLNSLRAAPKVYSGKEKFSPLKRQTPKALVKASDKKIEGACPVASPQTVCCNLRTIDAVENCAFACSYCTIQTFYHDHAVFDANFAEKLKAIPIDPDRFYHFGTGQASDSLVWGNRNGILSALFRFALDHPNVLLEFKTKSKNIQFFLENAVPKNVVCSWSLNTPTIIDYEEHFTANLEQRLDSARQLADRGIKVAFHFHPMVYYRGWEEEYSDLFSNVLGRFSPSEVSFISFGSVTFIKPVLQQIRELGHPTKIHQMELVPDPHGKLTYPDEIKTKMFRLAHEALKPWHGKVFLYLCMEKASLWEEVFGFVYKNNEEFEEDFLKKTLLRKRKVNR